MVIVREAGTGPFRKLHRLVGLEERLRAGAPSQPSPWAVIVSGWGLGLIDGWNGSEMLVLSCMIALQLSQEPWAVGLK